jgi:hypothetical protein
MELSYILLWKNTSLVQKLPEILRAECKIGPTGAARRYTTVAAVIPYFYLAM